MGPKLPSVGVHQKRNRMGEKVAVIGSRNWPDPEAVRDYIQSLDQDDIVVSGGARGVDQWAEIYAQERGLSTIILPANWSYHGRQAGLLRNQEIVDTSDRVVAFWDKKSSGTAHTISLARKSGKPTLVFHPPGISEP